MKVNKSSKLALVLNKLNVDFLKSLLFKIENDVRDYSDKFQKKCYDKYNIPFLND